MGEKLVLIAGAGPVGLAAALVLADAGIRVKVFEAADGIAEDPRASTFHPPTLEMFDRFGITPELHAQGLVCPTWQIRWQPSGERAVFDLSVLQDDTRYPYRLQCEQWRLTRAAYERLKGNPLVEIAFGAGVGGLKQDADGVSITVTREGGATESVRGNFLIGADGAHSFVRKAIGQSLEGDTYPETILITETVFPFQDHLEGLSWTSYCWRDKGNFSLLRLPNLWRVGIYPLQGMSIEEQLSEDNVESMLQSIWPKAGRYEVLARRPYRTHNRIVQRYRVGRVFLAGDAAHLNPPTGGMGMNGGLHDAFNLAGKLADVLRGRVPDSELDRYERQRRPVAEAEILAQADRNRARMREMDDERRRATMAELQATASDRKRLHAFALKSSMIEGLRKAAAIA